MTNFESVKKFMETFGQEIKEKAGFPNEKITSLRYDLIKEELDELKEAMDNKDIKEVAVFRYDKLYSFSKNYDKKAHDEFNSPFKKEIKDEVEPFFNERSYGIFENNIKDEKLHKQVEQIREVIRNS